MKILRLLVIILITFRFVHGQVENVPQQNAVYTFLKEMKVKNIIQYISEDVPNLSRFEVKALLDSIRQSYSILSETEKKLLYKYEIEFSDNLDEKTTSRLFTPGKPFTSTFIETFSNKVKYLFAYQEENVNVYFEGLGHYYHGQQLKPGVNNAEQYDIGFRIRGTVFNHLGYHFSVIKGGASGNKELAEIIQPKIKSSYKWIENAENIGNYEFSEAYLRYHTEIFKGMHLGIQLGREPITLGYGYGSKLVLSSDTPTLDFFQFNFDYGIVHFTSIHASTVGTFSPVMDERYTKYFAFNRLKFSLPNLFEIGIGESIIYSGRGIELAYLTPIGFYKFIEMSIQDRDNGSLYFDIQTNFIPDLELQGTFFLDENILSNLGDLERYTNKTAYQVGAFWYEAFGINDLSWIVEYTRIRPYVYTHINPQNNYTAWGLNLGHRIGPNSDELFTRIAYNWNEWVRISMEYRRQRSGENVYDDQGNLIKNVGGDIFISHVSNPVNTSAPFLDGIRVNKDVIQAGVRIEPFRDLIFDIIYNYSIETNITNDYQAYFNYGLIRFTLEY
jgi:Capsule assembly protein Wzi